MANDVDVTKLLSPPQNQQARQHAGSGHASKSPLPLFLLGLGWMAGWIILIMVDLEATESLYTHIPITSFTPEWSLLLQIPHILFGGGAPVPAATAQAAIVGWVLLFCTVTCTVGYDHARDAVKHANQRLEKAYGAGLIVFTLIDFIANVMFVPGGSNIFTQVLWALVVTFGGMFSGVVGFRLLEHSIKIWWGH